MSAKPKGARMQSEPAEIDMTPMIDMTFQLIAFFMVLVNFAETNTNERIKLPQSELAKPAKVPLEHPLVLQVTKEGTVLLGGDEVQVDGLPKYLSRERDVLAAGGANPGDAVVIIRAHQLTETGKVQEVIQKCQETRFERFALRAEEKESPGIYP